MSVPVGLSVFSGLGAATVPYIDSVGDKFESLWLPDHLQTNREGVMEGWTLLAYCLARYPTMTMGHQVLCNEFRQPAILAKMSATAQVLSQGRFVLGLGAGWHREEADAYGLDFPGTKDRFDRLAESTELIRSLWTGKVVDFDGRFYHVEAAQCLPAPEPVPPIMIGASGDRLGLRVVASSADWWNHIFRSTDEFSAKLNKLAAHCEAVDRDPQEITPVLGTQILIAETEAGVNQMVDDEKVRPVTANGIAGTPDQIYEELASAIESGAGRLIVGFADSPSTQGTRVFTETVLPRLLA